MTSSYDHLQRRLRRGYIERLPARIEALEALCAQISAGDPGAIAEAQAIAHQLAGSGASYGFDEITVAGRALEHAADEAAFSAYDRLLEVLHEALAASSEPPEGSALR